jgi:uncharacterized protein (DUF302 family)
MKRNTVLSALLLALGLAAGALPVSADSVVPNSRAIVTENISTAGFSATLAALKKQLSDDGWTLLAEIDLGERIAKRGKPLPGGLVILELTSGGNTIPLLRNEDTRYVAGLMPCSVSVYGLDDGRAVVSRMITALLTDMMEPRVAEVMKQSAARLDTSVAAALAKAGK